MTGRMIAGAAALVALAGCSAMAPESAAENAPGTPPATSSPPVARPAAQDRPAAVATPAFRDWEARFRPQAMAQGIRSDVYDRAFRGVGVNERVLELDAYQPEFRRQIWDYLDRAVSDQRVANGRAKWAEIGPLVRQIGARYGVDPQIILAIWGIESSYGATRGDLGVIESLATLAFDGRRREFAESQLIAALRILQDGDTTPEAMRGSWAGAMGHTQFIPTSYADYAQDWTGDGRRDVWGEDPADALASTANYLARFGWTAGQPWGVEVSLPAGFNPALAGGEDWRDVAAWQALGVQQIGGAVLPQHGQSALLAPAGARGPVFLIFQNFRVIRRYNNATSYALAVGHLGDRILGGGPFVATWPRDEQALSLNETIELQERLTALGYDTLGTDGLVGPNTITAIRNFQREKGLPPDGFPTRTLLAAVKAARSG